MPRLTNKQYLEHRDRLRVSWQRRGPEPFAQLSAQDQLDLYAYFAPTIDVSDDEVIGHRKAISEQFPLLPQRAGKAYKRARKYLSPSRMWAPPGKPTKQVVVQGMRRDQIDVDLLARALVRLAEQQDSGNDRTE